MKLSDRVEALAGPDEDIRREIALALGWKPVPNPGVAGGLVGKWWLPDGSMADLPNWLGCLNAALSLLPESWRAGFEQGALCDHDPDQVVAWVWPFESSYDPDWQMGQETQIGNPDGVRGFAATPALALCAAALRARGL